MELNYLPYHNKVNFAKICHPRICKKGFYTVFEEKLIFIYIVMSMRLAYNATSLVCTEVFPWWPRHNKWGTNKRINTVGPRLLHRNLKCRKKGKQSIGTYSLEKECKTQNVSLHSQWLFIFEDNGDEFP